MVHSVLGQAVDSYVLLTGESSGDVGLTVVSLLLINSWHDILGISKLGVEE
jgi:hypothetical protein